MKRGTAILILALAAASLGTAPTAIPQSPTSAVLIELFTAEGCSSCPPADTFLRQLDSSQPIPGATLIVLDEHVDYWDGKGWKDPFSSAALTDRQRSYERGLGVSEPYTPQFIVDGTTEMRLSDRKKIAQVLMDAAAAPKMPVRIDSIHVEPGTPVLVTGKIAVEGDGARRKSDVFLGLALDHSESKVLRGENRGQTLTHVAVLLNLVKLGSMQPGQKFSQDFRVPLKAGVDPDNVRLIAFVQESGYGKVVGAALKRAAAGAT